MNGDKREKSTKEVDMEPCSAQHFGLIGQDQYDKMKILSYKNFLCPRLDYNLEVEGLYTSERFSFLRVLVTKCNKTSITQDNRYWKPLSCGSDSYYESYMKNVTYPRLLIYTSNFNINPSESQNFVIPYIQDQQTVQFSPNHTYKNVDLFVKPVYIETDESIIFDSESNKENYLTFDTDETTLTQDNYLGGPNSPYIQLQLRRSMNTVKIQRSYKKLAELLYQIGGLVKCVFLLLGFFVSKYNKFQYRLELANKLYDYKLSTTTEGKEQQKDNKLKNINSNTNLDDHQCLDLKKNQSIQQFDLTQQIIERNDQNLLNIPLQLRSTATAIAKTIVESEESPQILKKKNLNLFAKVSQDRENNANDDKQYQISHDQTENLIKIHKIDPLNKITSGRDLKSISADLQKHESQQETIKNQLVHYFQQFISKTQKMKASLTYFLNFLSFRKFFNTERNYLIRKAQAFTKRDLDIYVILDKLQEIEKIKQILFDEEQINLFNFFPKPVIKKNQKLNKSNINLLNNNQNGKYQQKSSSSLNSSNNLSGDHLLKEKQDFTKIQTYQNLFESYKKLKNSNDPDEIRINHKLILELGEELLQIFQILERSMNYKKQVKYQKKVSLVLEKEKNNNHSINHNHKENSNQLILFQKHCDNSLNVQNIELVSPLKSFINNNESLNYNSLNQEKQGDEIIDINKIKFINQNQVQLKQSKISNSHSEFQSDCQLNQNEQQSQQSEHQIAQENIENKPQLKYDFIKDQRANQVINKKSNTFKDKMKSVNNTSSDIKSLNGSTSLFDKQS